MNHVRNIQLQGMCQKKFRLFLKRNELIIPGTILNYCIE